ncbi:sigma-54-dependent transcriptional regulator [Puniceicoccus vermicola]|uniref:DNA-binding transcriptional regulator NtrC n=1 Tax=Puniceicoccus vermicola TaxID=388746 RepID=A0A7X1E5J9_9BACT|nr:sigma-54 dependent transcriptional regulator [Puniceicoccus vermicola]MBC2601672.1 sigma-54-dependent Fis family transcriptional regulator [Puniceicoccus vermicola]
MPETEKDSLPRILIVDDDNEIRYSLKRVLGKLDAELLEAGSGEEGLKVAEKEKPEVILLDNRMGGISGMETLQNLRSLGGGSVIIMMTAHGTTQTAIEAMKYGAFDYLMKPFEPEKILDLVKKGLRAHKDRRSSGNYESKLKVEDYAEGIVGSSEGMQLVLKQVGQVTASDATVMITGESGTGKELVARCIHDHSLRSKKTFIAVNCAAIPDNLIESELFGHEKGSFTGATSQRQGKFELCDGGTLFLDEIGDMALPTQTKILRAIQEGEIQRVGGTSPIQVNVRVIAATNRDIEEMVKTQDFREDLYYRLNVFRIRIPPLRDRRDDIPEIIDYHLQRLAKQKKIRPRSISAEALEVMKAQPWNGNVRELENVVYRSAVVAQGSTILVADLPADLEGREGTDPIAAPAAPSRVENEVPSTGTDPVSQDQGEESLFDALFNTLVTKEEGRLLQAVEYAMIRRSMDHFENNQAKAASLLGMSKSTLRTRLSLLRAEESKSE